MSTTCEARFGATAERVAEHAQQQIETVREQLRWFVAPNRSDRAIDSGTGAGTLALALSRLVREVVGVDIVPSYSSWPARALRTT